MSHSVRKCTIRHVRPVKSQISLHIHAVWSESLLSTFWITKDAKFFSCAYSRPRWLSWMRCPTGDQEVAGSTPAEVGNILSWRLIMKYFLRSFSPFRWFKKGSCLGRKTSTQTKIMCLQQTDKQADLSVSWVPFQEVDFLSLNMYCWCFLYWFL